MRYYADAHWPLDAAWVQSAILDGLEEAAPDHAPAVGRARDGLIAAGMLEQAVADQAGAGSAPAAVAARMTDAWADRLAAAYRIGGATTTDWAPPPGIRALGELPARAILPEGYIHYGLFPDQYLALSRRILAETAGRAAVIVGVRSVGTSLSAALAAGLRPSGTHVLRATVRPSGDPFAREVALSSTERRCFRAAAARGAIFFVVDEGPGLSGSSLAATALALERCGAETGQVHLVCARRGAMPMASSATREVWARCRAWEAQHEDERFWLGSLPPLLGAATGCPARVVADLSWGRWAAGRAEPPILPACERRKLLLDLGGRHVLAKFIGFGDVGALKAALAARLARAGFGAPVVGYAHGMLLLDWLGQHRAARPAEDGERVAQFAAGYYAYLRAYCGQLGPAPIGELARTAADVARSWLHDAGAIERLAHAAAAGRPLMLRGDQKPEPVEWLLRDGQVIKADAACHFLDHSWAREQDICFDLAGFSVEFSLPLPLEMALVRAYSAASGDGGAELRLPFYRAVYAAHRLAALDTAYHGAQQGDRGRIDAARQHMGAVLASAVAVHGVADSGDSAAGVATWPGLPATSSMG